MSSRRAPKRTLWIAAAALAWASCGDGARHPTTPRSQLPRPSMRIVAITDLKGYLEPCGCQSRPLGGIDKMAATLARIRSDGVPTLFVASGDLLFDGVSLGGGIAASEGATQEVWKAQTLVDILGRLGLTAASPGRNDLAQGASTLAQLMGPAHFALLGAGVQIDGVNVRPSMIAPVGGLHVGLVGASDLSGPDGAWPAGAHGDAATMTTAVTSAVRDLKAQGADIVVALVNGNRRTARDLVRSVDGIDVALQGGLDDATPAPPAVVGRSVLLHASRQGHGLLVVDVYRRDASSPWSDLSDWSARVERERLASRITELEARIAAWSRDPHVDSHAVDEQRARLAELEAQKRALEAPRTLHGNGVRAEWHELSPDVHGDPGIAAVVDRYDARVNAHNRVAFANVMPPPAPPGTAAYVGSERCAGCHAEAFAFWRTTGHGHAYRTLTAVNKEFNLSCVGCHVTGYGRPGGSTVTHNAGLVDVGCENCHGAGSLHVADPDGTPSTVTRDAPESICLGCHTPEHSDLFAYNVYRPRILGPGHGQPMPNGSPVRGQHAAAH